MGLLEQTFSDRLLEINEYLVFLAAIENQIQRGTPKIGSARITANHQKILYAAVYLQLYNLVEATVTIMLESVATSASRHGQWGPGDLSTALRREWVRTMARTHVELSHESRLTAALKFCDHILSSKPVDAWAVERGGGGNWDDQAIERISSRLGCDLRVPQSVLAGIKKPIRNDKPPMSLVKDFRNKLAHGQLSFVECGDGVTVSELTMLKDLVASYLEAVVGAFGYFIDSHLYLDESRRPELGAYI